MILGQLDIYMEKINKTWPKSHDIKKIISKWIIELNVKGKTINPLRFNT